MEPLLARAIQKRVNDPGSLSDLELEDAACRAVQRGCAVKLDHAGDAVGQLVASWPLTAFLSAFAFVRDLCRGVARNRAWPPANGGTCANATRKNRIAKYEIRAKIWNRPKT